MIERFYASAAIRHPKTGLWLAMHHIKKTQHPWRFPGGKIELGETSADAVAREVLEELNIEILRMTAIHPLRTTAVDGGLWTGQFFLVTAWLGTPQSMEPEKIGDIEWLTAEELLHRDSHPEYEVVHELEMDEFSALAKHLTER